MRTIIVACLADGVSLSDDVLGRAGERGAVQLSINAAALMQYGITEARLRFKPASAPVLAMDAIGVSGDGMITVTVPDWAMQTKGACRIQLSLEGDGVVIRSYIWDMIVQESLVETGEPPAPVET